MSDCNYLCNEHKDKSTAGVWVNGGGTIDGSKNEITGHCHFCGKPVLIKDGVRQRQKIKIRI